MLEGDSVVADADDDNCSTVDVVSLPAGELDCDALLVVEELFTGAVSIDEDGSFTDNSAEEVATDSGEGVVEVEVAAVETSLFSGCGLIDDTDKDNEFFNAFLRHSSNDGNSLKISGSGVDNKASGSGNGTDGVLTMLMVEVVDVGVGDDEDSVSTDAGSE